MNCIAWLLAPWPPYRWPLDMSHGCMSLAWDAWVPTIVCVPLPCAVIHSWMMYRLCQITYMRTKDGNPVARSLHDLSWRACAGATCKSCKRWRHSSLFCSELAWMESYSIKLAKQAQHPHSVTRGITFAGFSRGWYIFFRGVRLSIWWECATSWRGRRSSS